MDIFDILKLCICWLGEGGEIEKNPFLRLLSGISARSQSCPRLKNMQKC